MVSKSIIIPNKMGLHLRPAGLLCQEALKYSCKVSFQIESITANAKSVLSVLGAGVKYHDEIRLICEGKDEEEALSFLSQLIENGLGDI